MAETLHDDDDKDGGTDKDASFNPQTSREEDKSHNEGLESENGSKSAEQPYLKQTAG